MIEGDEGKPMSIMERITDEPCDPEPYVEYLLAHYRNYREAQREALPAGMVLLLDHFVYNLEDLQAKMHRPGAPAAAPIVMSHAIPIYGRLGVGVEVWAELRQRERESAKVRSNVYLRWRTFQTVMNALRHCGERHYVQPVPIDPRSKDSYISMETEDGRKAVEARGYQVCRGCGAHLSVRNPSGHRCPGPRRMR